MTKSSRVTPSDGNKLSPGYKSTRTTPSNTQRTAKTHNKPAGLRRLKDTFFDAIYFISPECSCVQCSAIISGLITAIILILIFLYFGGYWDRTDHASQDPSKIDIK